MSNSFNAKKLNFIINFAYISSLITISYFIIKFALPVILPFILALAVAYIAEPTVEVLNKQFKIKRSVCSFITIMFIVLLTSGFFTVIILTLISRTEQVIQNIPGIINEINEYFVNLSNKQNNNFAEKIIIYIYEYIKKFNVDTQNNELVSKLVNYVASVIKSIPKLTFTCLITFIFSIFISTSFPQIINYVKSKVTIEKIKILSDIKNNTIALLKNYFKSYVFLMLITFSELSLAFLIFKINPAITLALIISLIDILPVFGVGTIMIPWSVVLFISGDYTKGILILAIYIIVTIIRQIIEPKLIGDSIGLPPVITLPIMFIGLKLFGVIGLILLPVSITIIYDLYKKGLILTKGLTN